MHSGDRRAPRYSGDFDPRAPEVHRGLPPRLGLGPGLISGATMLVMLLILSFATGAGPLGVLRTIASTFLGSDALEGGWGTALLGLIAHFLISALLGGLFVALVGRTTRPRLLGLGFLYSFAIWAFMHFIVLPVTTPLLATQLGTIWPFFAAHLGYGFMLGATVPTVADIDAPGRTFLDPLKREVRP